MLEPGSGNFPLVFGYPLAFLHCKQHATTEMPKQVKQLTPLLTVFETAPGRYSLRLSEISRRATFLSIEVAKLLSDARSLEVITPNDMKVFDMTGEEVLRPPEREPEPQLAPEVIGAMPPAEGPLDMDQVVEISQAEEQRVNGEEKRYRQRKPRSGPVAGFDEPCQRCSGVGTVQMLMEGGRAASGVCPVCQGEKVVRRFGARK